MSVPLSGGVKPRHSVSLEDAAKDSKTVIDAIRGDLEIVRRSHHILNEQLEEAQRTTRARAEQIDRYFSGDFLLFEDMSNRLQTGNETAFTLEHKFKESEAEFNGSVNRVVESIKTLVAQRQHTTMQLIKYGQDIRFQSLQMGLSRQIKEMALRMAWLKDDLAKYPASQPFESVTAPSLKQWQSDCATLKAQQESLLRKGADEQKATIAQWMENLDLYAEKTPHLNAGQFIFLTDTIPISIVEEHRAIAQHYSEKGKKLKEICVKCWNDFLLHSVVVEIKLTLISDCTSLGDSLPGLQGKFEKLQEDLTVLRHQFKAKNPKEDEKHLVGNHSHLSTKFEEMKSTFAALLSAWKAMQPHIEPMLKGYEGRLKEFNEWGALGFGTLDHPIEDFKGALKRLVEEDVKGWISPFQKAPAAIKAHLAEIALWMDITSAVVANPTWKDFPKRNTFLQNLMYLYSNYTTYRDQIKG